MYRVLPLILIVFSFGHISAQQSLSVPTNTTNSTITGTAKFYYGNTNEPPRAIEFNERTVDASYFVANINHYFDIPAEFTFVEAESTTDDLGMRHHLLQQYYKGIQLENLGYRVHEKNGFVTSANGKSVRVINLDTQTAVSEEQAFQSAKRYLNSKDTVARQGKKLIVSKDFTFTPESFSIAFQFDIDVSLIERWRISIDALSGKLINKVSLVNSCLKETTPLLPYGTGTGTTTYYGIKTIKVEKLGAESRLAGQTDHGGSIGTYDFKNASQLAWALGYYTVYDFYSSNNTFNTPYQRTGVSVQWAAEHAYEYYFKKFNRKSFDNKGTAITSYVHVDKNLDNAFWSNNKLLFGDGINDRSLVELDVVSHELTHGVTQYEAQLQYSNESGALNESFSDIMGKAVEFSTFGDSATWQLAKHYQYGGLRDMSNPNLKNQPDTYAGDLWYTGTDDSGGVHYNSGVQNFWFYLLCQGGNGVNDHQVNYSITSIGMDAAVKITYRNLTEYLSPASDYLDSRIGSLFAAADLYGKTSAICQEVDQAWDAVGVINRPIITSLDVYDITATTVKIKSSLLPRGNTVTYYFEYGTTPAFGTSSSVFKYTTKVEDIVLTGLQSNTKYYFRLVVTNENGSSNQTAEFTTISLAPLVKIKQTVDITETSAILYGQVNPNSLSTSFHFEYGPTPALGLITPTYPLNDATEFQNVSTPVANLQPRKTYYYRLIATNGFATSTSESVSFFTAAKPIIISYAPVSAPVDTEVIITGQNFNSVSEKNFVSFGATRATVLSSSSTELKVKVPSGASLAPITLLDTQSGLTAQSAREFVPTFTGGFKKGSLQLRAGLNDLYIWKALVQDMDNDHRPDIVGIHYQGFSIFQNVNQGGDLTNDSFVRNTYSVPDFDSDDLFLVDLDGNGLKDVVGRYPNGLRIFPNFSAPGYIFFNPPVELAIGYLYNVTFDDFDLDGRIDIAGTTSLRGDSSTLKILRNQNPTATLTADNFIQQYAKALPYNVQFLTSGDLNNDGTPDLIGSPSYRPFLSVLKNNSQSGNFAFEEIIVQDPTRGDRYIRYISHDLNQDGWRDIVSHSASLTGNVSIMENKATPPSITIGVPTVVVSDYVESSIQPGDMDGDGKIDLLAGFNTRKFFFLRNKGNNGEHLSTVSFEKFDEYGLSLADVGDHVDNQIVVNDLNGDGRPEVINAYQWYFGPTDGYKLEIWQNSSTPCPDPSLVSVNASSNTATIVLPPNKTVDDYEFTYAPAGSTSWYQVNSTTLYVSPGYTYQLRVRAKCYLNFTDYYYINFTTDCVNTSYFSISTIGTDNVTFNSYNYLDVQCSPAGKNQWSSLPQNSNQFVNLLPGTTYDLRMRGICNTPASFRYSQFTTLCPKLTALTITNVIYNQATVKWTSNFAGSAILEYSDDNTTWMPIDASQTMYSLTPGKKYYVRGRMACTNLNSDFISTSFATLCPKVSALEADNITPFGATINWLDESHAQNYTVKYSLTAGGPLTMLQTNSTSLRLDGLSAGTQYSVAVAPQCISAIEFTAANFITYCYVPFNLSASNVTHTTAELSWNDNFSGLPYSIDYSISGSNAWTTTKTALTTISLTDLRPGTKYEARVHITCVSEKAPYVSLTFETGLYEATTFAPNPADHELTIYPSKNLIGKRFTILDNAGRIVVDADLLDYTIDLSTFSTGVYILKIDGENPVKIVKR